MNRRQRRARDERRRQQSREASHRRPHLLLERDTYPAVKRSHIVPRMYQRGFAIDDRVAVHVDHAVRCVLVSTAKAGTRPRYYRRRRPNGEDIDDIEASLAYVEDKAAGPLAEVRGGAALTAELKGGMAQFLAVQMLRGPAFFEHREEILRPMLADLPASAFRRRALAEAHGDVETARRRLVAAYLDPTQRFMTMLTVAPKMASFLAHMRWQVLVVPEPWIAYSDHPVVLWPRSVAVSRPFPRQHLGPLNAAEIRFPLSPERALLLNWSDRSDEVDVPVGRRAAAELNAFTIGQADRQWMHQPGVEPPIVGGSQQPLSRTLDPSYDDRSLERSRRRRRALGYQRRIEGKQFVHDVEVLA